MIIEFARGSRLRLIINLEFGCHLHKHLREIIIFQSKGIIICIEMIRLDRMIFADIFSFLRSPPALIGLGKSITLRGLPKIMRFLHLVQVKFSLGDETSLCPICESIQYIRCNGVIEAVNVFESHAYSPAAIVRMQMRQAKG